MSKTKLNSVRRPWWVYPILIFCVINVVGYIPYDLFLKPVEEDQQVWFGFMLTGWAAKATTPIHWLIYGLGTWGLWEMKRWVHPWLAIYVAYIGLNYLLWSLLNNVPIAWGIGGLVIFGVMAAGIWYKRDVFVN